jgi:hypothetical protein
LKGAVIFSVTELGAEVCAMALAEKTHGNESHDGNQNHASDND